MLSNALERSNKTKAVTCLRSIASRARSERYFTLFRAPQFSREIVVILLTLSSVCVSPMVSPYYSLF